MLASISAPATRTGINSLPVELPSGIFDSIDDFRTAMALSNCSRLFYRIYRNSFATIIRLTRVMYTALIPLQIPLEYCKGIRRYNWEKHRADWGENTLRDIIICMWNGQQQPNPIAGRDLAKSLCRFLMTDPKWARKFARRWKYIECDFGARFSDARKPPLPRTQLMWLLRVYYYLECLEYEWDYKYSSRCGEQLAKALKARRLEERCQIDSPIDLDSWTNRWIMRLEFVVGCKKLESRKRPREDSGGDHQVQKGSETGAQKKRRISKSC